MAVQTEGILMKAHENENYPFSRLILLPLCDGLEVFAPQVNLAQLRRKIKLDSMHINLR